MYTFRVKAPQPILWSQTNECKTWYYTRYFKVSEYEGKHIKPMILNHVKFTKENVIEPMIFNHVNFMRENIINP